MKTILVDAVYCFVVEKENGFGVDEEMHKLLESYPNRKIVLTGADDEQFKKFNLANVPYEVFTLKHNPDKVSPEYYQILLKQFGLNAEDVIYFEHDPKAVESAKSVGINSYYYDGAKRNLVALKEFLDNNI